MILTTVRNLFNPKSTAGDLMVDDKWFCYTLEGIARVDGVKIEGRGMTCIPAIGYKVGIHYSPRFKRNMLILYTHVSTIPEKNRAIRHHGAEWTHVYAHGGNWAYNSLACPLIAFNRISANQIWKSAEKALFELVSPRIRDGENVKWFFANDPRGDTHVPRPGSYA